MVGSSVVNFTILISTETSARRIREEFYVFHIYHGTQYTRDHYCIWPRLTASDRAEVLPWSRVAQLLRLWNRQWKLSPRLDEQTSNAGELIISLVFRFFTIVHLFRLSHLSPSAHFRTNQGVALDGFQPPAAPRRV
jgi:hypothetical protein